MIATRIAALALVAVTCLQIAPAQAQSTMLTGCIDQGGPPVAYAPVSYAPVRSPYVAGVPQYDPRPVAPPPAYYRPAPPQTVVRTVYVRDRRTYWQRHPMIKSATIGAGVGAGVGALTGLISRRGVLRGAAIGAGTGAGIGVIRSSRIMRRHPIVRDVATGALAGLGIGWASSRRHGRIWQATGVGAAIGLGVGLFKHLR